MKVLAIETATAWQSVALLDGERVLGREDYDAANAHGTKLLPTIDRLLSGAGLSLSSLDGLICSCGPGSFTGLRVGISTMLGLRAATDLPLVLVPTLEAMAWTLKGVAETVCPVLPSRKGEVYWALFRWHGTERLERVMPERVGSPESLAHTISGPTLLCGEGWTQCEAAIRAVGPASAALRTAPPEVSHPSAVSVGMAGLERLHRGEVAGDLIAPLYVQRTEAEIVYERSGGLSPVARRQARVARKTASRAAQLKQGARKSHE
ncbi:MAG: tRNA (adenosine(37)-N6)-threonylcarbamoyltransferase complex dimerization subunit type 1 TsaB [Nitrospira sp.]